jgi:hypothetical protein
MQWPKRVVAVDSEWEKMHAGVASCGEAEAQRPGKWVSPHD